jgi:hypothetical protein
MLTTPMIKVRVTGRAVDGGPRGRAKIPTYQPDMTYGDYGAMAPPSFTKLAMEESQKNPTNILPWPIFDNTGQ